MTEAVSVEVLTAEVRVLQVGNRQITRSIYRQLDAATFERFEPFGRVRDNERDIRDGALQLVGRDTTTGVLVRYDAYPPDWSPQEGPLEFGHWLLHTKQSARQQAADGPDGRRVVWTRNRDGSDSCPGPSGWHVSKNKPDLPVIHWIGDEWSWSQWSAENKEKRCTVNLGELEHAWRTKAAAQLAELLRAQANMTSSRHCL